MAAIRISRELLLELLTRALLLPAPIERLYADERRKHELPHTVEIETEIDGFAPGEHAMPIYERAGDTTRLVRFDRIGGAARLVDRG